MIAEGRRIWYLVAAIVIAALVVGALVFLAVREPQGRPWDYGTTGFVPGQSPYAIHRESR